MKITKEMYDSNLEKCLNNIKRFCEILHIDNEFDNIQKYIISYEKVCEIGNEIITEKLKNFSKTEVGRPKISLNLAPQASGKTSLNEYAVKRMQGNCIVINSDQIKYYYPKAKEISSSNLSVLYSYISDIGSNLWTACLLNEALNRGVNIVFEGTGKSSRILKTLEPYRNTYKVKVRTIGVSSMTSLCSIILRYTEQREKKENARLVRAEDFMNSYEHTPRLLEEAENAGYIVEIFSRGPLSNSAPVRLYSSHCRNSFLNAVDAVNSARNYNRLLMFEENMNNMRAIYEYLIKYETNSKVYNEIIGIYHLMISLMNKENDNDF